MGSKSKRRPKVTGEPGDTFWDRCRLSMTHCARSAQNMEWGAKWFIGYARAFGFEDHSILRMWTDAGGLVDEMTNEGIV